MAVPRTLTRAEIAFVEGGHEIVTVSGGLIARWQVLDRTEDSGVLRHVLGGEEFGFVYAVVFHPRGRFLVSAGWDGQVVLWDAWTERAVRRLRIASRSRKTLLIDDVFWSPDGETLVVQTHGPEWVWVDPWTGEERGRGTAPGPLWRMSASQRAASAVGRLAAVVAAARADASIREATPRIRAARDLGDADRDAALAVLAAGTK